MKKFNFEIMGGGRILFCIIALFSFTTPDYAQETPPCGFGSVMQKISAEAKEKMDQYDKEYAENPYLENGPENGIYRIPVVFHIMHNGGVENIGNDQVIDALDQLNYQFAGGEGGFDTQIQFYLASIDPYGACTEGINRIYTNNPYGDVYDFENDKALKDLSRWNPEKYVNIWIVKCIKLGGICSNAVGYAYYPGSADPSFDGIVISHDFLGESGTASANNTNALTHEMGHYLSLIHVWGDDNNGSCENNCHAPADNLTKGDKVGDTNPCRVSLQGTNCDPSSNLCSTCPIIPAGSYPKENYMSYFFPCQDRFTEGQANKMKYALDSYRSGLWDEVNLTCTGTGGFFGTDIVIDANTTWTTSNLPNGGNITIKGNLTIQPNSANNPIQLIIGPGVVVHFCHNGKVVIKPNASLNLYGTLTNSCNDTWKGVEVWGDNTKSQYSIGGKYAQGRLYGRNGALIENADIGARLWGPDYYSNAGGQIFCSGTTFRNNRRAVEFAPYENKYPYSFPVGQQGQPQPYFGSFSRCSFETNNDYPSNNKFDAFLHLTGVRQVRVSGSSFTNDKTITSTDFVDWGYGIYATDAGFILNGACDGSTAPCSSYTNNQFNKLGYGIYAAKTTGNEPYIVQQSTFNQCFMGVYNKGVSESIILFNKFNLGRVPSNTVIQISPAMTPPLGTATEQDQVGIMFESAISGFVFEENEFNKVDGNVTNTVGSLCKNIGTITNFVRRNTYNNISHGNVANDVNAINNNFPKGLSYECNNNTNVSKFDFLVSQGGIIRKTQGLEILIDPILLTVEYSSAGNIFSYNPNAVLSDFKNLGQSINYRYNSSVFGEEPLDISGGINKNVADKNDCLASFCKPPCKTNEELSAMKLDFYSQQSILTGFKNDYLAASTPQKADRITAVQRNLEQIANTIVLHTYYDTLNFHQDTLRKWIGNINALESDLWLASDYTRTGNNNMASSILTAAPAKYQLNTTEISVVNNFKAVLDLVANQSVYQLSDATRNLLKPYTQNKDYAATLAQNILSWYGEHYPPAYILDGTVTQPGGEGRTDKSNAIVSNKALVSVTPNPTDGFTTIRFNIPASGQDISLRIVDVNGKTHEVFNSLPSLGEVRSYFSLSGIYFYQLSSNGRLLDSGKIIVNK
jgi:hypothetical protein